MCKNWVETQLRLKDNKTMDKNLKYEIPDVNDPEKYYKNYVF